MPCLASKYSSQINILILFSWAKSPLVVQGLLIIEGSQLRSDKPHSVRFLCTSDQPVTETSIKQPAQHSFTRDRHP